MREKMSRRQRNRYGVVAEKQGVDYPDTR